MAKETLGLTPRAKRGMMLAQQEALRRNQSGIAPEHLLLGLIREGSGMATAMLQALDVDVAALRATLEAESSSDGASAAPEALVTIPGTAWRVTPETATVFSRALAEAKELKHGYIGQEHLLLALLREGGHAAAVLAGYFVTYDLARSDLPYAFQLLPEARSRGYEYIPTGVKRYNLALPQPLFDEVERLAEREGMTVLEVLRRSAKLSLLVDQIQRTPGAAIIIRDGDRERQLVVL